MSETVWEKRIADQISEIKEVNKESVGRNRGFCEGITKKGSNFLATWDDLPGGNFLTLTIRLKGNKDDTTEELINKFKNIVGPEPSIEEDESEIICRWMLV